MDIHLVLDMRRMSGESSTEAEMSNHSSDSTFAPVMHMQHLHIQQNASSNGNVPFIQIVEQPIDKFRFRYKSEMHGTHGSLTGMSTNKRRKTYPSVQLLNFQGEAIIKCSLYQTNTAKKCLHSHSLVVRRDNEDCRDPHDVHVSPSQGYTAIYQGMGIIHTAKKFIGDELLEKLLDRQQFLQNRPSTDYEKARLKVQAEQEAKTMNLNQVALCFEAFQKVGQEYQSICEPVLSTPINNMKSALTGELKITRLSTTCSDAAGNTDLFLFVEKVGKKNIKVRFYQTDENEEVIWEDFGKFSPEADVHHQYAIALRTPVYHNIDIEHKVQVYIQLVRPSDNCVSNPVDFYYKPRSSISTRKRARMSSAYNSAELPTVVPNLSLSDQNQRSITTISKEYDTDAIINSCLRTNMGSFKEEELEQFLKLMATNSDEMEEICEGVLEKDGDSAPHTVPVFEKSLKIMCRTVHDISQKKSKMAAAAFLESLLQKANKKNVDILHIALSDELEKQTAIDVINLIQQYGLSNFFNMTNAQMQTPLHIACVYNRSECISIMLKFGANPNKSDKNGYTPLHSAVEEGFADCVRSIIDPKNYPVGSQVLAIDKKNDKGLTPLHLAIRKAEFDIFKMLEGAGASLKECESSHNDSVLQMAVQEGDEVLVKHLLLSTEMDFMHRNHSGYTAFDLALRAEPMQLNIVNMIREKDSSAPPATIKEVTVETTSFAGHLTNAFVKEEFPLFDQICFLELSNIFNEGGRWKQLAQAIRCESMIPAWANNSNSAHEVLKRLSREGFELHHVVNLFLELDGCRDALICLDQMIARRMEDE